GSLSASAVVTVSAAAADHFTITVPLTVVSGVPFDVVVTATDPYGNTDTNYAGTVTLSSSDTDPGVALPADYTFTPADGGVHMFPDTGRGETPPPRRGDGVLPERDGGGVIPGGVGAPFPPPPLPPGGGSNGRPTTPAESTPTWPGQPKQ